MKKDCRFKVIKAIPLANGEIAVGTEVHRIHDVYYINGMLLPSDYQKDFDTLIATEQKKGWKYIRPVIERVAFRNEKEDLQ